MADNTADVVETSCAERILMTCHSVSSCTCCGCRRAYVQLGNAHGCRLVNAALSLRSTPANSTLPGIVCRRVAQSPGPVILNRSGRQLTCVITSIRAALILAAVTLVFVWFWQHGSS